MDDNRADNARLEPAIRSAMSLRGSVTPPPEITAGERCRSQPPSTKAESFTIEDYTAGVDQEIEDNFLIRDWEKGAILQKLTEAYGPRYSSDDLTRAIELANRLNYCAVFVQSSCGNSDEGIAELEKEVPGFSRGLYSELLGHIAYINR